MLNQELVSVFLGLATFSLAIRNGDDVPVSRAPYMASLLDEHTNFVFCGGFIFSQTWILTAASCLDDKDPEWVSMRLAAETTDDDHLTVGASFFKFHPEYRQNQPKNTNDIALVKSVVEIQMVPGQVAAIQLPYVLESLPPGTICFFSGTGITQPHQTLADRRHLQVMHMRILEDHVCEAEFGDWFSPPNFCASALGTAEGDVCEGDFGGPLICEGTRFGLVAYGLAKRSNGNCQDNKPVLFTDIALKRNWVYRLTNM